MVELKFDPKSEIIYKRVNAGESFFEVARSLGMYTKNAQRLYREYTDDLLKLCAKHADTKNQMTTIHNRLKGAGIHTIDEFHNTSLNDIFMIYGIGKTAMTIIIKMKEDI